MRLRGSAKLDNIKLINKAKNLLDLVGLKNAISLYPNQLSGGMRQRVALARTLFEDKPVVLMDEPFSALDTITRIKLQTLASDLLKNRTILFVTHDPLEALRLADHIYIMAGQPASVHAPLMLSSSTPRDPGTPDIMRLQAELLYELTKAHEVTS
jgi:putative hydroxymethylpyrimidine transport system ATP-binding protein